MTSGSDGSIAGLGDASSVTVSVNWLILGNKSERSAEEAIRVVEKLESKARKIEKTSFYMRTPRRHQIGLSIKK